MRIAPTQVAPNPLCAFEFHQCPTGGAVTRQKLRSQPVEVGPPAKVGRIKKLDEFIEMGPRVLAVARASSQPSCLERPFSSEVFVSPLLNKRQGCRDGCGSRPNVAAGRKAPRVRKPEFDIRPGCWWMVPQPQLGLA